MATFQVGQEVKTDAPKVSVEIDPRAPLAAGKHRFRLVVEDVNGIQSEPVFLDVTVLNAPTAVLRGPSQVRVGASFDLTAEGSQPGDGRITTYLWTLEA